ncbi:hypothetical protein TSTA_000560 [Talaromyces stipitatus ATCC 10500]|uniref:Protein kinase domain-containing protein n=1 Tax=Talaromyces stipitatus (strain ATCC 10500 / CBS 375.48 / QM 6759 / NRRL 1006) TaxID=441959 RepID=B8MST6_TALSN|nr:uncharacterized protein TSTA_000560 [Talaromyces stipitatus ATCC 10500]EED11979.1 hypothetical protein TSTA_000560 [Talaromyces stipitatus ATCC 10500]
MATLLGRTSAFQGQLSRTYLRVGTKTSIQTVLLVHNNVKMPSLWTGITSSLKPFSNLSLGKTSTSNAVEEPLALPTSGFTTINVDQLVEEEELPDYRADRFYPVQLGDIFQNRYQVVTKLGFGTSSTTWLARK